MTRATPLETKGDAHQLHTKPAEDQQKEIVEFERKMK